MTKQNDYQPDVTENINEQIQEAKSEGFHVNDVSDGYHTFGELYEHRIALYIALCVMIDRHCQAMVSPVWVSKLHSDGMAFDGWFILGVTTDQGQISYHLTMDKWDEVLKSVQSIEVLGKAPEWDGHTSADVLQRLKNL